MTEDRGLMMYFSILCFLSSVFCHALSVIVICRGVEGPHGSFILRELLHHLIIGICHLFETLGLLFEISRSRAHREFFLQSRLIVVDL
jgi:hypothetical protein